MQTGPAQKNVDDLGLPSDHVWVDHPDFGLPDGTRFKPRAAILRGGQPAVVICAMSNAALERGLTGDITAARLVTGAEHFVHLRSRAGTALVGRRVGDTIRYGFTDTDIALGEVRLAMTTLCSLCEEPHVKGWSDTPLSGQSLPHFSDLHSFLAWWDFYPGKQKFELHDGEVQMAPRAPAGLRTHVLASLAERLPGPYEATSGLLVKIDQRTAICPDIVIGPLPSGENPFVPASVAPLVKHGTAADAKLAARQAALSRRGVKVIVVDHAEEVASHNNTVERVLAHVLSTL